jgi:SAM-dependent methyltransferase
MNEINYNAELLRRDKIVRTDISALLHRIKANYEVSGKHIIELGCGLGQNMEVFVPDNFVSGIDGVCDAVDAAKAAGLNVILADLEKPLPLEAETMDWVLCLDVLEHLLKPMFLMKEIYRILPNNGKAILNVPNHFVWLGRVKIALGSDLDVCNYFPNHREWENPHIRFFTRSGFLELIQLTGFRVVEDFSHEFPTFPMYRKLQQIGLSQVGTFAARYLPALFAGGHFMIVEKA